MVIEDLRKKWGECAFSFELEPQAFGEVPASDARRIELLDGVNRRFRLFQSGVGAHGQIRGGGTQVAGVVDAANRLFGEAADAWRQRRHRKFCAELFLKGGGAGERIEHILPLFAGRSALFGAGGHRQFVGPLLGFRGAFVEGGLILRFRIGSRVGGRFLPFFIGFRFQEGIGCEFLRQPFLQVEQRQGGKFQRLELARGELLFLPERGR